jgi:hypothetical protein
MPDMNSATKLMTDASQRRQDLLTKISAAARSLVPILKDHNLLNTAAELDRLFFEYDANEQEVQNAIKADPTLYLDALIAKLGGPPR